MAGENLLSFRITVAAGDAMTELGKARSAISGLGADVKKAGDMGSSMQSLLTSTASIKNAFLSAKEAASVFSSGLGIADKLNAVRAGMDQSYAATKNVAGALLELKVAQSEASNAVNMGAMTADEAAASVEAYRQKVAAANAELEAMKVKTPIGEAFEKLRASIDPAFAAMKRFQALQAELAAMVASGEASQAAANIVLEQAASKYMGVATAAERAAAAQAEQAEAAAREAQEADRAASELDALANQYATLRASVDPAAAAIQRFMDAEVLANHAVQASIISQQEATQTLAALSAQMNTTGQAVTTEVQALINSNVRVKDAFLSASDSASAFNDALNMRDRVDQLRASIDYVYQAELRLKQATNETAEAVRLGAMTEGERADMLLLLQRRLAAATDQAKVMGGEFNRAGTNMTANVFAQLNDIGVMMASGQNPLILAIQQGTQLTQVFAQAGGTASGAMSLLKGGLMSLLSPMSLVTVGTILAGSALVQWAIHALGASKEGKDLKKVIDELTTSTSEYSRVAKQSFSDLKEAFGEVTPEVIHLHDEMVALAGVQAIQKITEAVQALKAETEPGWLDWATTSVVDDAAKTKLAEVLDLQRMVKNPQTVNQTMDNPALAKLQTGIEELGNAKGFDAQIAAVRELQKEFVDAAGGMENLTLAQADYLQALTHIETQLIRNKNTSQEMTAEQRRAADAFTSQIDAAIKRAEDHAKAEKAKQQARTDAFTDGVEAAIAAADVQKKAAEAADRELVALRAKADIRAVELQYGRDSAHAALERLEAERAAYAAELKTRDISEDQKRLLLEQWDAANGIARAQRAATTETRNLAHAHQVAATEAHKLWSALEDAAGAASTISATKISAGILSALGPAATLAARLWDAAAAAANIHAGEQVRRIPGGVDAIAAGDMQWYGGKAHRPIIVKDDGGAGGAGAAAPTVASLSAEAKKTLEELDLAIAAINERVKAGLMSTADAGKAIVDAKAKAGESVAELIAQVDRLGPAGQKAAEALRANLKGLAGDLKGTVTDLSKSLAEGFTSPFADFIKGTISAGDAFERFGDSILNKMIDIAAQQATMNVIAPLFGKLLGGIGGGFGDLVMGAFGVTPHAKGGVIGEDVVSKPTLFGMPGGKIGLMGEAGPEAIMPLKSGGVRAVGANGMASILPLTRAMDGSLAVSLPDWNSPALRQMQAFAKGGVIGGAFPSSAPGQVGGGGGGGNQIVNIQPPAGHQAVVSERSSGVDRITDVIFEAVSARLAADTRAGRGAHVAAMQDTFGLRRATR